MLKLSQVKGSSLLTALIFAFVLMVIISALAYNFRVSMLTVNALINKDENLNVDEGYMTDIFATHDVASTIDESIDESIENFRFLTVPSAIVAGFSFENTNIELYQSDPYLLSSDLTYNFFNNSIVESTKNLIFNSLVADILTQYDDNIYPLNVPYVNSDSIIDSLDTTYKLDNDGKIVSNKRAYIGYIQKNSNNLNINASGTNSSVIVPNDLSVDDYKFSVGWDLKSGNWNIFLAVYDSDKTYTSSTPLDNLVSNASQAQVDLADWQKIVMPSGSGIVSGSTVLTKWFQDSGSDVPKPLILRKVIRSENGDEVYDLDVHSSTYNTNSKVFTATSPASFRSTSDLLNSDVIVALPDNLFTLDTVNPLIQEGQNFMTYNPVGDNLSSATQLAISATGTSVIVRKNSTDLYYIIFNGSQYYQYNYTGGAINGSQSVTYPGETISKIITKFGALFIFTNQYLHVNDFNANTLNTLSIDNTKEYQVLRNDDGNIYIMPDGLACNINNNCNSNNRIYIDTGCSIYCDEIAALNNIYQNLGLVYRKSV
ncbi:hypothetical protein IB642_07975 [Allofrancisella guangzhouensis]|uniref:Uncharacterized protein n=1 Tax=Allofrancisella guangzhouensis TaxID=594679 RepID=A0A0A8E365_9GAMM|nr:hypothetical protein [Allofrancisella guangzhouensis]AJC48650.1 hypothetical protein SD28_02800 [Allofrancisella guangzhouensis]MBK2027866.1 hypothetical protein [Allofrancisella guangzhouensis]MBK2044940.1 hypothetical protein [Allofrancisella guangzhouensis]MBK2046462.1 hypothetical protein [Allofrancisella guangzhouensis]